MAFAPVHRGRRRGLGGAQLHRRPDPAARQRPRPQPVDLAHPEPVAQERRPRTDDDPVGLGLQTHHVEGLGRRDAQAPALADGEADDAVVPAEHAAPKVHDVAGPERAGAQPADHVGIRALGHEADVLAVGLGGDGKPEPAGQVPGPRLVHVAQGEAQVFELLLRGGEQEIALVAHGIDGAVEFSARAAGHPAHVVAGGERVGAELPRHSQEVAELDRLVAAHAGDGSLATHVGIGEIVDHRVQEAAFEIEHVVGNAERVRHPAGIVDVLAGAARPSALHRPAVVV